MGVKLISVFIVVFVMGILFLSIREIDSKTFSEFMRRKNGKTNDTTLTANIINVPCSGNRVKVNGLCRPTFNGF